MALPFLRAVRGAPLPMLAAAIIVAGCAGPSRPAWERVAVGAPPVPATRPAVTPATPIQSDGPTPRSTAPIERTTLAPVGTAVAASPGTVDPASPATAPAASELSAGASAKSHALPSGGAGKMVASATPQPLRQAADPAWTGVDTYVARHEDTLLDLAVTRGLGFIEVAMANPGVDPWLPGEGTPILLPKQHLPPDAPREGIVINLPEQRLYHYQNGRLVRSYPIGIGRDGHATPVGTTSVVRKTVDPVWRPTPSARADDPELPAMVPAGPDNPLGSRALYLGWTSYLIHGTNKEYGIGRRASRGCIRMYDRNVRELYERVAVGTPVTAVDQPVKVAWIGDDLFIEASPTIQQVRQWEEEKRFDPVSAPEAHELVLAKAGKAADRIDWSAVDRAVAERRGIVTRITKPTEPKPFATAAGDRPQALPSTAAAIAPSGSARPIAGTRTVSPDLSGRALATPSSAAAALAPTSSSTSASASASAATVLPPASPSASAPRTRTDLPAEPTGDDLVKWLRGRLSSGTGAQ